jgi:hypothetical protein
MHFTDKTLYKATAAAIAYNDLKTPEALINPEKQLTTLAKFQAGGATILEEKFGDIEGDPTNALLNYIQDHRSADDEDTQTVIGKIIQDFNDDMYTLKE